MCYEAFAPLNLEWELRKTNLKAGPRDASTGDAENMQKQEKKIATLQAMRPA